MPSRRGARRFSTGALPNAMADRVRKELLTRLSALQASLVPRRSNVQLAPISKLPNELLVIIFRDGLGFPDRSDSLPFELAVSGVCRAWRAVALDCPDLWTRIFITARTPISHMLMYSMRSANHPLCVEFCHWPAPKRGREHLSTEVFLDVILTEVREFTHRFQRFAIWDVSDNALLTILAGLVGVHAPLLQHVSVQGHPSVYATYYAGPHHWFPFPFLTRNAPCMTHLEILHMPIESLRSGMRLSAAGLVSLTLRAAEDLPSSQLSPFTLPAYLIGFEDLILLLRSTTNLTHLALYGPVVEFDDDAFIESSSSRVELKALRSLILHCREPGYRYHCDFLSALTTPELVRLEIPWHDDLEDEMLAEDLTDYLFDDLGSPKFASVRYLYLHDSAVKWRLPTRSFIRAFPNAEDVTLGGNDVWKFIATLRGLVRYEPGGEIGRLPTEAWSGVRKLTLRAFHLQPWKGCVRGLVKWLAAERQQQAERVVVRVEGAVPSDKTRWFLDHLEKLNRYADVENAFFVSG